MATTSFPHNSTPTVNRGVAEAGWRRFGRLMLSPGVILGVGSELAPSIAGGDRLVTVAAGELFVDGFLLRVDDPTDLFIGSADPVDDRIDRIVARYDPEGFSVPPAPSGTLTLQVIEGVPDAYPVPEPLVQTETGVYDVPVAQVVVQGGAAFLDPADVIDERVFSSAQRDLSGTTAQRLAFVPDVTGVFWFDTDLGIVFRWDGSQWEDVLQVAQALADVEAARAAAVQDVEDAGTAAVGAVAAAVQQAEDAAAAAEDAAIVFAIALGG